MCYWTDVGRSTVSGETMSPGKILIFSLYRIIAEQIGESYTETCWWDRRTQHDKLFYLSAAAESKMLRGTSNTVGFNTMKRRSRLCHCTVACLWISLMKHKASRYTARGYPIRQNNSIDLKIVASQLLCDQSISFPLCLSFSFPPLLTLPSWEYSRPSECVFWRWTNSWGSSFTGLLWNEDRRRRRRRRGRSQSQRDQCRKWNVDLLHRPTEQHHC